jgi:hypothetical protein
VKIGGIELAKEDRGFIPPVAGIIAVVAGVALVAAGRKKAYPRARIGRSSSPAR